MITNCYKEYIIEYIQKYCRALIAKKNEEDLELIYNEIIFKELIPRYRVSKCIEPL